MGIGHTHGYHRNEGRMLQILRLISAWWQTGSRGSIWSCLWHAMITRRTTDIKMYPQVTQRSSCIHESAGKRFRGCSQSSKKWCQFARRFVFHYCESSSYTFMIWKQLRLERNKRKTRNERADAPVQREAWYPVGFCKAGLQTHFLLALSSIKSNRAHAAQLAWGATFAAALISYRQPMNS